MGVLRTERTLCFHSVCRSSFAQKPTIGVADQAEQFLCSPTRFFRGRALAWRSMASQVRWPIRLWRSDRRDLSCRPVFSPRICTGMTDRYDKLLASIIRHRPAAVFLGGDLLPRSAFSAIQFGHEDFVHDYLVPVFTRIRDALGVDYPDIFLILGNDDPRRCEEDFVAAAADGLWHYVHGQKLSWGISPSMALPMFHRPHFC